MNDLNFELHLVGRKAAPLTAEVVRPLRESDLVLLSTERGVQPSHVKRLSDRHHALARCLATGMGSAEACAITGYTPSRMSILKGDPAFEELLAFYRAGKGEAVQDLGDKLLAVARTAADELQDRLEDTPEAFDLASLESLVKTGADRSGYGPKSTQVNVNVNLGDRLKAARERASAARLLPASDTAGEARHEVSPALLELKASK